MSLLDPEAFSPEIERRIEAEVDRRLNKRLGALEARVVQLEEATPLARDGRVTLIVHSGDLDRLMAAFWAAYEQGA